MWAARHEAIDREIALKIPEGPNADNPDSRRRFLAEARALGRLRHPNIVDVLDSGTTQDGRLFIAFELLEGSGLDAYLHDAGRLRGADAVKIAIELCRGLEFAHGAGVIHRDLKPGNVYLHQVPGGGMLVKLLDFGISKTFDGEDRVALTQSGSVVGTPLYMSAEQARGDEVDSRTDLWNVGVLLYEMLAGLAPFEGKSYSATVAKIVSDDAPRLSEWGVYAPAELEAIIDKCLKRNRKERYQSATELRRALEEVLPLVRNATPPRMSIASLSDSISAADPASGTPTLSSSAPRIYAVDAPTIPPPESSLRPTSSSLTPATPQPSNLTVRELQRPRRRAAAVVGAAVAALALVGALAAFLSYRSAPSQAAPGDASPVVPASLSAPVARPEANGPAPANASTASARAAEPAADSGSAEAIAPAASSAADKQPAPIRPTGTTQRPPRRTKVDDPGF